MPSEACIRVSWGLLMGCVMKNEIATHGNLSREGRL